MAHFGTYRSNILPLTDNGTAGYSHPLHSSKPSGLPVRGSAPRTGVFSLSLSGTAVMETNMWGVEADRSTPLAQRFEVALGSIPLTHYYGGEDMGYDPASAFRLDYGGWRQNRTTRAWGVSSAYFDDYIGGGARIGEDFTAKTGTTDPHDQDATVAEPRIRVNVRRGGSGLVVPVDSASPGDVMRAMVVSIRFYRLGYYFDSFSQPHSISENPISRNFLFLGAPQDAAKPILWRPSTFSTVIPAPADGADFAYLHVSMSGDRGITQPQDASQWPDFHSYDYDGRVDASYGGFVEPGAGDPSYRRMTVSNLALSLTRLPDS